MNSLTSSLNSRDRPTGIIASGGDSFEQLAREMEPELGTQVDHFHCRLPTGEEVILFREKDGRYMDIFGWVYEPEHFTLIEGQRFHGFHEVQASETDLYRDGDPELPDNLFVRFWKRLVSF